MSEHYNGDPLPGNGESNSQDLPGIGSSLHHINHQFHIPENIKNLGHQIAQEIYYDDDNAEEVRHFHYKQELHHKFTVSSIIGLGFSLMNVPDRKSVV